MCRGLSMSQALETPPGLKEPTVLHPEGDSCSVLWQTLATHLVTQQAFGKTPLHVSSNTWGSWGDTGELSQWRYPGCDVVQRFAGYDFTVERN